MNPEHCTMKWVGNVLSSVVDSEDGCITSGGAKTSWKTCQCACE